MTRLEHTLRSVVTKLNGLPDLMVFIKPGAGHRPAHAWFLEIVSSANVGVCVCVRPRGH